MKLTNAQKEVVLAMEKGLYLWTNEQGNPSAWLGDEMGKKQQRISIQTAHSLVKKKRIRINAWAQFFPRSSAKSVTKYILVDF